MRVIFESLLMPTSGNYQSQSMLDETTAYQSWFVFLQHTMYPESRDSTNVQCCRQGFSKIPR